MAAMAAVTKKQLQILRGGRKLSISVQVLCFRRADFCFFRKMVGRISWETVPKSKGAQEGHHAYKEDFLQA